MTSMDNDPLEQLLAGAYPDPDGGVLPRLDTQTVLIAPNLTDIERDAVAGLNLGRRLALVSDPDTHAALGGRVKRSLAGIARIDGIRLPRHPYPDAETVSQIRAATAAADALIAVGSGTINDLCKYAAALDRKPYIVFGTAPSMNGYTSVNAAITVAGHKKSLPAHAPLGVFLDLTVLANAPPRLIRSGFGDSLCRSTAQGDWLLAHLLRDEPYRELPFRLLEEDEPALLAEPEALFEGDLAAMERLARTLVLSGFGMTLCGGSYPASQGEHLISHYADMMRDPAWPVSYHGEQIAVTTLTVARLQEQMLAAGPPRVRANDPSEAELLARFGTALGRSCWKDFSRKRLSAEQCEVLNAKLAHDWPEIRRRIQAVAVPSAQLETILRRAGAPTRPEYLNWAISFYQDAVLHAREIRNRYTFLDLAANSGLLTGFVNTLDNTP